jgi:carbon-monoxide dehydrogenase large subunit
MGHPLCPIFYQDAGRYVKCIIANGPGSSTNSPASAMGGVYNIPAVFMAVSGVFTNTVPIDA